MSNKPLLSLAMIVKDEHEALERCLSSFAKYVDEIVVVANDPPSSKLKAVVAKFNGKLYPRKWNKNFSDARNYSFEKCAGEVIFWVDVDDTVTNPEKLPKLAKAISDGSYDWVSLRYDYKFDEYGRCVMAHWKPRLTRKDTGKWAGAIHETYMANKAVGHVKDDDVVIVHHTADNHTELSGVRNLDILLAEFQRDKENTDPRTLYYLGNTLMGLGKFEEAIPFYMAHIQKCGWLEEKYFSMHYLSQCLSWVGRADEAINASLESIKIIPEWAVAYYDLAYAYMLKQDWHKEIHWILTGMTKTIPTSAEYMSNPLDYELHPYQRLADAYLQTHNFDEAMKIAEHLKKKYPDDKDIDGMYKDCLEVKRGEDFVKSFVTVAGYIRDKDRLKAARLFEALPTEADHDVRIQGLRKMIVPPKVWDKKTVAIYCHPGHEEWAYPSLFTGIGGSEEMVIRLSTELNKQGYKVTVYCRCGTMAGEYYGVKYVPYYHFNPKDKFDVAVIWRYPGFLTDPLSSRKTYVWLHDIVHDTTFNEDIIKNTTKFMFLSKWHRNNAPQIPDEKIFLTRNAIDPKDFVTVPAKKLNSLVWTSSYDRGAVCLGRDILPLIEAEIPEVTLDIAYGTANLEKEMDRIPILKETYEEMQKIFKKKNVTHHGRLPHKSVHALQAQSMIHAYASEFGETFNISSIKAQANGTYVITMSQAGATPEYIRYGKVIAGDGIYSDKKLQRQYADEVIKFLKNPTPLSEEERGRIIDEYSVARLAKEWVNEFDG